MKRIFISYSHQDGDFADAIRSRLEEAGIPVWKDTDLYGGQQWRTEIDLAIREALALVVVLSSDSATSDYVSYEWAFALGAGVNVVPLLLHPLAEPLHAALQNRQYLDFSNRSARPWELLFRAVKGVAGPTAQTTIYVPPNAPPVIEQAARALDSMDEKEREAALKTLESMKHPALQEVLAGAIHHPIEDVRIRAAHELLKYGDPRALPGILEGIHAGWNPDERVLNRLGPDAVPELLTFLEDRNGRARSIAAITLGRIGDPAAIEPLKRLLRDIDPWVRRCAVGALGHFRDPSMLPIFEEAYREQQTGEALEAASLLPNSAGEKMLFAGMAHREAWVRSTAARLLRNLSLEAALPVLVDALSDDSPDVRKEALKSLIAFRDPATAEALLSGLQETDSSLRTDAGSALLEIGGPSVVALLVNFISQPSAAYPEEVATLLGELGDASAAPALIPFLLDERIHVRRACIAALTKLTQPGSPAVTALIGLLSDTSGEIVEAAADALGTIGDPAAAVPLANLVSNPSGAIRRISASALKRIGTSEARALLATRTARQGSGD